MKTVRLALAAAVVAFMTVVAPTPAQAYPGVTVTVSEATVVGGNSIEITATVTPSSIDCSWSLTFLGDTRTGTGNSITETFSTPTVSHTEHHEAVATCSFDNGVPSAQGSGGTGSLGTSTSVVTAIVTATGSGTQTLLPRHHGDDDDDEGDGDGDGGGILPNTGGERLLWLIIGGLLVMTGGGVVMASRRRDA
jgi:LPXTG-motif cell wall-anchored protein